MKPVLVLDGFGVAFAARTILLNITLSIPPLGCTVLLGPSGTGKSTLMRTLAGLNDANPLLRTWGHALYQGEPLSLASRPALMTQKAHLLMATVQDNMIAKLPQRASLSRALQIDKVRDFLQRNGRPALAAQLATPVIDLPLHEQRIIAILRQALRGAALLMLDEPTANLQPDGAQAVLDVLRILARQRAVLVVSHHLAQTRQIADHVILIADGVVKESAATNSFFLTPQTASARHYLRTGSCPESGIANQASSEDVLASATATATDVAVVELAEATSLRTMRRLQNLQPDPAAKSAFCGPRGFVWLIDGKLAGTPLPGILQDVHRDLQALCDVNITRLISLTEAPFDATLAASYGIQCTALPMPDMHAPSLAQAWFLCHEIDRYLGHGEVVAVHCKAGLGRTGTVLALYWIWLGAGQVSGKSAMEYVRRQEVGMIQSLEQENFLEKFAGLVDFQQAGTMVTNLAFDADFFKNHLKESPS